MAKNIFDINKKLFNSYIWNTPLNMDKIVYYLIQSSLPSLKNMRFNVLNRVFDFRVHVAIFMPSGSGKGGLFNYVGDICDKLGLKFYSVGQMTDSALIGSMKQKEVYDPTTRSKVIDYDESYGFLNPKRGVDIVAMNETDILFDAKKTDYAKDLMTWFQKAMNPYRTKDNLISKDLSSGRIEFYSNVNLLFVSKLPANFYKTITSTGFLQRTIVVYSPVPFHQKKTNDKLFLENVDVIPKSTDKNLETITKHLEEINDFYKQVDKLTFTRQAKDVFVEQMHPRMHNPIDNINSYIQETLSEFISRYQEMAIRIAYHNAIARKSTTVDTVDALNSMRFVLPLWENVISFIEEGLKQPTVSKTDWYMKLLKMQDVYFYIVNKNTGKKQFNIYIPAKTFFDILMSREYGWGCTRETAVKRFEKALSEGYAKKGRAKGLDVITFVKEVSL